MTPNHSLTDLSPLFIGIDLALRRADLACLDAKGQLLEPPTTLKSDEEVLDYCRNSQTQGQVTIGLDSPLQFPLEGNWRSCDQWCQRNKMPLYSPNAVSFRPVVERAIGLIASLEALGCLCYEVYPYAARVRLRIGVGAKKTRPECRAVIQQDLSRLVDLPSEPLTHDALDAILAAYTVWLYSQGKAEFVGGEDGQILIPFRE